MAEPVHPALMQALAARQRAPRDAVAALNLGHVLIQLGRMAEAETALRDAVRLKRDFAEARFDLGQHLHRTGKLDEAEAIFRALAREMPGTVHMKIALGAVLIDQGHPGDAEIILRRALGETGDPVLKSQITLYLGTALRRQRKDDEAMAMADTAVALDTASFPAQLHRAEALENAGRDDEAMAVFQALLKRAPGDPGIHHAYNELLYRLRRDDEYLKSYDGAPASRPLLLGKAFFLSQAGRDAQAHAVYQDLLAKDPNDPVAALGAAKAAAMLGHHAEAVATFDALIARQGMTPDLCRRAAEPSLLAGDPQKAAWYCEMALEQSPRDGAVLALQSIAWRMMDDERDEVLGGYDTLVRVFELEPPDGFSRMEDFNAELDAALDRLHPGTREFLGQSLRGGTQTPNALFGSGLELVEKLQARIDETVARYIAELAADDSHPFLSRRARDFRYAGSWSSRLKDRGFHVNHIHPMGWISSCYYVAVPPAVEDETARQGWIKFGEPSLNVRLKKPVRRAIQPAAGRLILFPSYLWHGTIPFHDQAARTTIAFDAVPAG
jgi:tetratricopeptide (TPR) repeat protein